MPLISVVMPAYNAGVYIEEAYNSLNSQTFQDWELIVVNDGSTDDTLSILESIAEKDSRVEIKTIKQSGTCHIPRLTAISLAKTEWIVSLDADDFLSSNSLSDLIKRQKETDADIVISSMCYFENNSSRNIISTLPSENVEVEKIYSGKEAVMFTINGWQIGMAGVLIRKKLYSFVDLTPKSKLMNYEEYQSRVLLLNSDRVAICPSAKYMYRANENSLTQTFALRQFDSIETYQLILNEMLTFFDFNSNEIKATTTQLINGLIYFQTLRLKNKKRLTKDEQAFIKKKIEKIYKSSKVSNSNLKGLRKLFYTNGWFLFSLFTKLMFFGKHKWRS